MLWHLLLELVWSAASAGFVALTVEEMIQVVDDVMKQIETGTLRLPLGVWGSHPTHSQHVERLGYRTPGHDTHDHFREVRVKRRTSPGIVEATAYNLTEMAMVRAHPSTALVAPHVMGVVN